MTEEKFNFSIENLAVYLRDRNGNTATIWILDTRFLDLSTDDFEKLRTKVLREIAMSKTHIEYLGTDGRIKQYNMDSLQDAVDTIMFLKREGWHIACISESFSYLTKRVLGIRFWPQSKP